MCHSCEDISSAVHNSSTSQGANFTISLDAVTPISVGPMDVFFQTGTTFASDDMNIVVIGMLIGTGEYNVSVTHSPNAISCELFPCVREYNSSVTYGVLKETVISSTRIGADQVGIVNDTFDDWYSYELATTSTLKNGVWETCNATRQGGPGLVQIGAANVDAAPPFSTAPSNQTATWFPEECVWSFRCITLRTLSATLWGDFEDVNNSGPVFVQSTIATPGGSSIPATTLWRNGTGDLNSTNVFMGNLADFLTAEIRRNGAGGIAEYTRGSVLINSTCLGVEWRWLSFHAVVMLLTLVFFLILIFQRGDDETTRLWKSSSLAVLFCSIDEGTRDKARLEPTKEGISKAAKGATVRVVEGSDGTSRFE
jgi:hypothetical protein